MKLLFSLFFITSLSYADCFQDRSIINILSTYHSITNSEVSVHGLRPCSIHSEFSAHFPTTDQRDYAVLRRFPMRFVTTRNFYTDLRSTIEPSNEISMDYIQTYHDDFEQNLEQWSSDNYNSRIPINSFSQLIIESKSIWDNLLECNGHDPEIVRRKFLYETRLCPNREDSNHIKSSIRYLVSNFFNFKRTVFPDEENTLTDFGHPATHSDHRTLDILKYSQISSENLIQNLSPSSYLWHPFFGEILFSIMGSYTKFARQNRQARIILGNNRAFSLAEARETMTFFLNMFAPRNCMQLSLRPIRNYLFSALSLNIEFVNSRNLMQASCGLFSSQALSAEMNLTNDEEFMEEFFDDYQHIYDEYARD